jgi:hypothetical protein
MTIEIILAMRLIRVRVVVYKDNIHRYNKSHDDEIDATINKTSCNGKFKDDNERYYYSEKKSVNIFNGFCRMNKHIHIRLNVN